MAMAGHRRAVAQLLLCLCRTALCAAALSFDYNFSSGSPPAGGNLLYMGDSALAGDRINLTKLSLWSTGRVAHRQLVRLWDDGGVGKTTSFTTAFSFAIDRNSTDQADGMAFFVGPPRETLPPDAKGGFLGLIPNNVASPARTVGVEFDTCRNDWDPPVVIDHVGIDVNSIASKNTTALPALSLTGVMRAEIRYDAASTTMAVTLRLADGTNYSVESAVDLRAAGVPQDAAVGFSAATGDLIESHKLLSWSFHSTADGSNTSSARSVSEPKRNRIKTYIIASTSSLLGASIFFIAAVLVYKQYNSLFPWQRRSKNGPRIQSILQSQLKSYTYSEVPRMTKSFNHTLGKGGYGTVYKGSLSNGKEVAVKMLEDTKGDGEEFINEVVSIGRTSHINVVTLLGFCLHGSKRALIYEYMGKR